MTACDDGTEETLSVEDHNKTKVIPPTDDQPDQDLATETQMDDGNEPQTIELVTKVEGRKVEFLDRLDTIQNELDSLPEKEDADNGVTNAMKSYYGQAYEMYDDELNEIYGLLRDELSEEIMRDLQTKQLKWIEDKENLAKEARIEYEGKTFENVAWYMSLYESTKERSYELVNDYMTD